MAEKSDKSSSNDKQPATRNGHGTHTPDNPQGVKAEGLPRDEYPADAPDKAEIAVDDRPKRGNIGPATDIPEQAMDRPVGIRY